MCLCKDLGGCKFSHFLENMLTFHDTYRISVDYLLLERKAMQKIIVHVSMSVSHIMSEDFQAEV